MYKGVINKDSKVPKMIRFYYLYRMKKIGSAVIGSTTIYYWKRTT